jgi:hypothetical protein
LLYSKAKKPPEHYFLKNSIKKQLKPNLTMNTRNHLHTVVSVEEFSKMTSAEICNIINTHEVCRIEGGTPGVDRHIVYDDALAIRWGLKLYKDSSFATKPSKALADVDNRTQKQPHQALGHNQNIVESFLPTTATEEQIREALGKINPDLAKDINLVQVVENTLANAEADKKSTKVVHINPSNIVDKKGKAIDLTNTKELADWLLKKYQGKEIEVKDDGRKVAFYRRGLEASAKKRGETQRQMYADLGRLLENGIYSGFEIGDAKHPLIKKQNIYYSAAKIGNALYGIRFKIDIPRGVEKGNYKDHIIVEIEKSPSLYIGHSKNGNVSYQNESDFTIAIPVIKDAFRCKITQNPNTNQIPTKNLTNNNVDASVSTIGGVPLTPEQRQNLACGQAITVAGAAQKNGATGDITVRLNPQLNRLEYGKKLEDATAQKADVKQAAAPKIVPTLKLH